MSDEHRQNVYSSEYIEADSDEGELNEAEIERQIEEFRHRLERLCLESTGVKRKMKPNVSSDWLKGLRQRLKSSPTETSSIERE